VEVLSNTRDPRRQTLLASMVVGGDERDLSMLARIDIMMTTMTNLDLGIVRNGRLAIVGWKCDLEDAKVVLCHLV